MSLHTKSNLELTATLTEITGYILGLVKYDNAIPNESKIRFFKYLIKTWSELDSELERLKQCEAIVRELATTNNYSYVTNSALGEAIDTARQWVKENERHTPGDDGGN